MSKRILLIGGNFMPEQTGIGKYNGEMIQWFARNGYECTVISTSPYYPHWKVQEPYSGTRFQKEVIQTEGKAIEVYRCPHYVPTVPNGTGRLLSEISFSASSLWALLRVMAKKKFQYVLTVAPPFQLGYHALLYKTFRGAKFLYHIQDMQIEAARDLNLIKSKGLLKFLFRLEKSILKRTDVISSISSGMQKKIAAKTGRDILFFPNWVDTGRFFPLAQREGLKERFGFLPTDKVVLYSGAMGEKQGLDIILQTARSLRDQSHLKFVLCGSGPYKIELKKLAEEANLTNVYFIPLQKEENFNAFLNMADVHLVIQKAGAGDLVMPSKLTTILAVGGLALVTAENNTSLYKDVTENGIGRVVEPENCQKFTDVLLNCLQENYQSMMDRARTYAIEELSIDRVLSRYATTMEGLQGTTRVIHQPKSIERKMVMQTVNTHVS